MSFGGKTNSDNYTRENFIGCVNQMASEKRPFLFAISFLQDKFFLSSLSDIKPGDCLYQIGKKSNIQPFNNFPIPVQFHKTPVTFSIYKNSFDRVMEQINYGNSYLTNLTFATPVKSNLSLHEIFHRVNAPYKLWLKDQFVCFSPETFIKIHNGKIYSFPMKGTIDASKPNARETILADQKELAEHYTIVDLIRNDLGMVAQHVKVNRFRYVEQIKTNQKDLLQISSEIEGKLPPDYLSGLGNLILNLLPAGSVSGAPKKRTMEIIQQAETGKRGWYTGIAGLFDGKDLDSFVLIRFIAEKDDKLVFHSGGGITCRSQAESEYQEMIDKVYLPLGN